MPSPSPGWRPHLQLLPRLFSFPSCLSAFPFPLPPPRRPNRTRKPRFMELLFELLLTAAATLLVAVLLAKLFSSSANTDPRHDRAAVGPADVIIAEETVAEEEEEKIIEVGEAKVQRPWAAAPTLSEGWVEVEKSPAAVTAAAWVAQEEAAPAALAPELFLGTVLEERKEEGEVGKTQQRDLTAAATEAAGEAKPRDLGDEAVPRQILDLEPEKETVQQRDLAAEVAPGEVLDAELKKQEVQPTEAAVVEQRHLVAEAAAPAQVITDAGLEEEEEAQADELIPHELASETLPDEVLDVVTEKQEEEEEHVTEVDQHELAAEVSPREIPDEVARELAAEVASRPIANVVATEEELKEQSIEEVADQHEEVQNKEEAQCELGPVDQQEKLVPEEEMVVTKSDDLNVSQEGSSIDKVAVQLPEKEATLLGMPEDEAGANMEFEEWEGIERSEVEKRFGAAAAFAASDAGAAALSKLDSDVQLQLQGLLKVAIDGPCYDSTQPLTLRPSSRAKWVSWQKLGNMHPEIAMEKYMDLLSEFIPMWMGEKTYRTKKHEGDVDSEGDSLTMTAHTSNPQTNNGNEGSTSMDEGPLASLPDPGKGHSSDIPAE